MTFFCGGPRGSTPSLKIHNGNAGCKTGGADGGGTGIGLMDSPVSGPSGGPDGGSLEMTFVCDHICG